MMHELIEYYERVNHFGREMGFELTVVERGKIEYRMELASRFEALPGYTHGGALAGLMDGLLGVAALSHTCHDNRLVATLDFKIDFLEAAETGTNVLGIGEVMKAGKRIVFARAEIVDEASGTRIAVGTGTFKSYPFQKS